MTSPAPRGRRPRRVDPAVAEGLRTLSAAPTDLVAGLAVTRIGRSPAEAETVVLLHGLGSARSAWAPLITALTERYHVLALDLPGHGSSAPLSDGEPADPRALADRVQAGLHALGVHRPHLMGSSLGGWIGFELAAAGELAGLTGLAPAGLRLHPGRPNRWLKLNRAVAVATGPVADPLLAVAAVRRVALASGSATPAALDVDLARAAARAMRQCTGYERALDGTIGRRFDRADAVHVPVTVVFGDDDRILPAPGNQLRTAAPPHARWVLVRRCGHAPMWDAPQECLRLLDETVAAAGGG